MKTSDLIKQAEELLTKCAKGPFEKNETWSGISVSSPERGRTYYMSQVCMCSKQGHLKHYADSHAEFIVFARNHMQELVDRLKKYEAALVSIEDGSDYPSTDAREALEEE